MLDSAAPLAAHVSINALLIYTMVIQVLHVYMYLLSVAWCMMPSRLTNSASKVPVVTFVNPAPHALLKGYVKSQLIHHDLSKPTRVAYASLQKLEI